MSRRTEHYLTVYFRVVALSCSAQRRASQSLLSIYLGLVLGDMILQIWRYFESGWHMNDFQAHEREGINAYVRFTDAMNVAYLLAHMTMVIQALVWRNRERRLLAQLPHIEHRATVFSLRLHLALECAVSSTCITFAFLYSVRSRQLLANLRYLYSMQAVRARYLQMAWLVMRLDTKLLTLQQQLINVRRSNLELRSSYAHILRLARQLSRLYGLSVLEMNMLCIGDFIMICYAHILLWQLTAMHLNWMLLWQTIYVMLPTVIKIWTLFAACDKCAKRSHQLQVLLNVACQETRKRTTTEADRKTTRDHSNEFALQIMQNPVQFDVCGIYHLNLKTLTGMFLFILESLVVFLQFMALTKHDRKE